uniref:Mariner Mos1 transposase n=1 Tax=Sipha flava TaxID=143950 RepID=A0A2S2Q787_9HEMI
MICQDLNNQSADINFIKNIITGDETWVYSYDREKKLQSSQWETKFSPQPKKAHQVRSSVKTMLIVFYDIEGIFHYEFVSRGQIVNQVFYKDVLIRLQERIRKKRPEKWRSEIWYLHHDNAPTHSALSIREFLAEKKIPAVPHPPYSPDLAPYDFFSRE